MVLSCFGYLERWYGRCFEWIHVTFRYLKGGYGRENGSFFGSHTTKNGQKMDKNFWA